MASAKARRILDRYVLEQPIGRGGMGVVWKAEDTLLSRPVAIKEVQLPPALAGSEREQWRRRVMREARAAARLSHHGVVTLYDVVREEGRTWIVMELVEARTLADIVREQGPLSARQAADVGRRVLDALLAAHRRGIIHRDVKPGNVMVLPDGRTKLADFGIASLSGDPELTATGTVLGSPSYMAPEQASGEPATPASDLYSLGATLYFAVEGVPPFSRGAALATLTAVVHERPRPMHRAGPLAPILTSLLAKDPEDRPSGTELMSMLDAVAEERGTLGQQLTATLSRPPWRRGRRRPWPRRIDVAEGPTAIQPPEELPVPPAGADTVTPAAPGPGATAVETVAAEEATPRAAATETVAEAGAAPADAAGDTDAEAERGEDTTAGGAERTGRRRKASATAETTDSGADSTTSRTRRTSKSAKGTAAKGDSTQGTAAKGTATRRSATKGDSARETSAKGDSTKGAPAKGKGAAAGGKATDAADGTAAAGAAAAAATAAAGTAGDAETTETTKRRTGTRSAARTRATRARATKAESATAGQRPATRKDGSKRRSTRASKAKATTSSEAEQRTTAEPAERNAGRTKRAAGTGVAAAGHPGGATSADADATRPETEVTGADAAPAATLEEAAVPPAADPAPPRAEPSPARTAASGKRPAPPTAAAAALVEKRSVEQRPRAAPRPGTTGPGPGRERPVPDAERDRSRRRIAVLVGVGIVLAALAGGTLALLDRDDPGPGGQAATRTTIEAGAGEAPSTTAPPTTTPDGAEAPPRDWARYANAAAGYVAFHPPGWRVTPRGGRIIDLMKPGSGTYLRIDWTPTPGDSALGAWRAFEPSFASRHRGYRRIRLERVDYRGLDAAIWEYSYTEGGTRLHAVNLGFVASGDRGFALNFQTREDDWASELSTFETIQRTFRFRG